MSEFFCPRGVTDPEKHRKQHLVHVIIRGRFYCVTEEAYHRLPEGELWT